MGLGFGVLGLEFRVLGCWIYGLGLKASGAHQLPSSEWHQAHLPDKPTSTPKCKVGLNPTIERKPYKPETLRKECTEPIVNPR